MAPDGSAVSSLDTATPADTDRSSRETHQTWAQAMTTILRRRMGFLANMLSALVKEAAPVDGNDDGDPLLGEVQALADYAEMLHEDPATGSEIGMLHGEFSSFCDLIYITVLNASKRDADGRPSVLMNPLDSVWGYASRIKDQLQQIDNSSARQRLEHANPKPAVALAT